MSDPIASFNVATPSLTTPTVVVAQTFQVLDNGSVLFYSANGQTVAAFAAGQWTEVKPVVAS